MYIKICFSFILLLLFLACRVERVNYINSLEDPSRIECSPFQESALNISNKGLTLQMTASTLNPEIREKVTVSFDNAAQKNLYFIIFQDNEALCLSSSQGKEKTKVLGEGFSTGELYLRDPYRFATSGSEINLYFQEIGQYSVFLEAGDFFGKINLTVKSAPSLRITGIDFVDQETSQKVGGNDRLIFGRVYSFVASFAGDDEGQEPEIRWYAYRGNGKILLSNEDETPLENNALSKISQRNPLRLEVCLVDNSSCKDITKSIAS